MGLLPTLAAGGCDWYTGSAAWLYVSAIESILVSNFKEIVCSSIRAFPSIGLIRRYLSGAAERRGASVIKNPHRVEQGVETILVDGNSIPPDQGIHLIDDGEEHHVEAFLCPPQRAVSNLAVKTTNLVNHHPKNRRP